MDNENLEIIENEETEEVTDLAVCEENDESKVNVGTVAIGVGILGLAGYGLYKVCKTGYNKAKAFVQKRKDAKNVNQNDYEEVVEDVEE